MKEALAVKFKNEWRKLTEKRASVDHEIAKLAHEIRAQFASGESGRAEAVDWVMVELGRSAVAARSLLDDGEAWACVRSVEHWTAIGGLRSARIVASLSPKQRLVVLSESVAKADTRKRALTSTQVRDIAWRHGFVEKTPPAMTAAKQNAALIAFVNRLYATQSGLPPLPQDIRSIVKPTTRRALKAA